MTSWLFDCAQDQCRRTVFESAAPPLAAARWPMVRCSQRRPAARRGRRWRICISPLCDGAALRDARLFRVQLKDANRPQADPIWSTLSWNGATPANTSLEFRSPAATMSTAHSTLLAPTEQQHVFTTSRLVGPVLSFVISVQSTLTTITPVTPCSTTPRFANGVDCSLATITPTPARFARTPPATRLGPAG